MEIEFSATKEKLAAALRDIERLTGELAETRKASAAEQERQMNRIATLEQGLMDMVRIRLAPEHA